MKKVLLCVLDGFGHGKDYEGNALTRAHTPVLDGLMQKHPWTLLSASGEAVGIPADTQGGSEVGHLTMGAGRIILQPLLKIDKSIQDKSFFQKPELLTAAQNAKENDKSFHILGMISDQGIHAALRHCLALLDFAKQQGLTKVFVHGITDGRDVPPKTAQNFVKTLQDHMQKRGVGQLATLIGRYYAMDRDKNLGRTQKAFDLYTKGTGEAATDPIQAIQKAYDAGLESDYYLEPIVLKDALIQPGDSVIFFNFRTDRAAQITEKLLAHLAPAESNPAQSENALNKNFVAFGAYTEKAPVAFPPEQPQNTLGAILAKNNLKQLRIAETEKYAHVTFFLNCQEKDPYPGETRIMVNSPKVTSYAEKPEMSAPEITEKLLPELEKDYSFIGLNFANLDLVGHSGHFEATKKAIEVIDECLGQIIPVALKNDTTVLITGDHGNAEYMIYEDTGGPCPSHTRNPVPLILISPENATSSTAPSPAPQLKTTSHEHATGGLVNVAPTILTLLGLPIPEEMTGIPLI